MIAGISPKLASTLGATVVLALGMLVCNPGAGEENQAVDPAFPLSMIDDSGTATATTCQPSRPVDRLSANRLSNTRMAARAAGAMSPEPPSTSAIRRRPRAITVIR